MICIESFDYIVGTHIYVLMIFKKNIFILLLFNLRTDPIK